MGGRSIHIGLNFVDPAAYGGWDGQLAGCINDANAMRGIAESIGLTPSMLIDSQATASAVTAAISQAASQLATGDFLFLSYSGHGGQVPDVNGDEEDPNDETWVLWDRQLIDDELYQLWSQFAPGVRILMLSDSCHSGTVAKVTAAKAFRAAARSVRSTRAVESEDRSKELPLPVQDRDVSAKREVYDTVQWLSGPKTAADVRASVLLISGCQDNQLSYDGAANGRFTQELLHVWSNGSFQGDYVELHRLILDRMPPDQSPNLYRTGSSMPEFERQRPFTVDAPAGLAGGQQGSGGGGQPASSRPMLRRGAYGDDVRYLQERLRAHGYMIEADSFFGPGTEVAVKQFQQAQGLGVDGVVGGQTWAALEQGTAAVQPTPSGGNGASGGGGTSSGMGTSRPTLRQGASGDDVRHLQERLIAHGYSVGVDGMFGPYTASVVRTFQRDNALDADGIVGSRTWEALERQPVLI